jgi:hypothetical protein
LIKSNKLTCLRNIKEFNEQIHNKGKAKSKLAEGMDLFNAAIKELNSIEPPFEDVESEEKARQALRDAVQNVLVEYLPEKRQHRIDVSFKKIGIKKDFADKEPYEYRGEKANQDSWGLRKSGLLRAT